MSKTVTLSEKNTAWLDDLVERGEHPSRQAALDAALEAQRNAWVRSTLGRMLDEGMRGEAKSLDLDRMADEILTAPAEA